MTASIPRRRNNPALKREQILAEAIRLLAHEGFYRFTVEELARRSGVSKGGLLHHFRSKEQLLLALLEEFDRRAQAFMISALPQHASASEHLRMFLAYPSKEPELSRLYSVLRVEALNPRHPAHDYFRERERSALASLKKLVAEFAGDPEVAACQLHALSDGLILQWLSSDQSFDLEQQWVTAVSALLAIDLTVKAKIDGS